jgi:hypothetical protein
MSKMTLLTSLRRSARAHSKRCVLTPDLLRDILLAYYKSMPDAITLNINFDTWNKYLNHRYTYEEKTRYLSNLTEASKNEDYQEIIKMGDDVVKYILFDFLTDDVWHVFIALYEITKANPIQYKNRGKILRMAEDWIRWGLEQKII